MTWLRDNVAPWASIITVILIAVGGWVLREIRKLVDGRLDSALQRISELEATIRNNGYARAGDLPGASHPTRRAGAQHPRRRQDD